MLLGNKGGNGEVCNMLNADREIKIWSQPAGTSYPIPFSHETGIQNLNDNGATTLTINPLSGTYNLMGQKISRRTQKGLYIVNGKKVIYQ